METTDEGPERSLRGQLPAVLVGVGHLVDRVEESSQAFVVVVVAELRQARRFLGLFVKVGKAIHSLPRCRARANRRNLHCKGRKHD